MSLEVFRPCIDSIFGPRTTAIPWTPQQRQEYAEKALGIARRFEAIFLGHSGGAYVNGFSRPTIADLMAYNEIAQCEQLHICKYDPAAMPMLCEWIKKMKALPEHDNVHQSINKLGELVLRKQQKQ